MRRTLPFAAVFDLPFYYGFDNIGVLTPMDVRGAGQSGPHSRVGSGSLTPAGPTLAPEELATKSQQLLIPVGGAAPNDLIWAPEQVRATDKVLVPIGGYRLPYDHLLSRYRAHAGRVRPVCRWSPMGHSSRPLGTSPSAPMNTLIRVALIRRQVLRMGGG
jgi:hypothetical protein